MSETSFNLDGVAEPQCVYGMSMKERSLLRNGDSVLVAKGGDPSNLTDGFIHQKTLSSYWKIALVGVGLDDAWEIVTVRVSWLFVPADPETPAMEPCRHEHENGYL